MSRPELVVSNLSAARGGRPVLRDVSFTVSPGEITTLLGANGAGKSTLVLSIAGMLPTLGGSVRCGDVQLLGLPPDAVRRHGVALALEGHPVFGDLSVRDNLAAAALMHGRRDAEREVEAALDTFPELHRVLATAAANLSGGQKQMVVLAQGMIARPRFLLIDELSLGLAPLVVNRLAATIKVIAQRGVGILLIEQFTTLALAVAKHALVLERGELVYRGSCDELRCRPEILHGAYLGAKAPAPAREPLAHAPQSNIAEGSSS